MGLTNCKFVELKDRGLLVETKKKKKKNSSCHVKYSFKKS